MRCLILLKRKIVKAMEIGNEIALKKGNLLIDLWVERRLTGCGNFYVVLHIYDNLKSLTHNYNPENYCNK